MKNIILVSLFLLFISCNKSTTTTDSLMITPADGHFANQSISLRQLLRYEAENAYFEGQKDALSDDIRIEKVEGCDDGWRWVKSPWDQNSAPMFIPPLCSND